MSEEKVSLDNWHTKSEDLITSAFGKDPVEWIRIWGQLSLVALIFLPLSALAYSSQQDNPFYEMLFYFFFFSPIPAVVGWIRYLLMKSKFSQWNLEIKQNKVAGYFLSICILGVIASFLMNAVVGLSRFDCGPGCGVPMWLDQITNWSFIILWVILPLYFWWKVKQK